MQESTPGTNGTPFLLQIFSSTLHLEDNIIFIKNYGYSRDPNKRGVPNKRPGWKNGTCEQFGGVPTFSIHALT